MVFKHHEWNTADTFTSLRIVSSIFLLFFSLSSPWFFVIYTFAGLTDVLDGFIARKTGKTSEFGAKLDSISDLIFYFVMLVRIFPVLLKILPKVIWFITAGIIVLRFSSYVVAAVKFRCFASLHTWLNKLTGFAVFLLPYILLTKYTVEYSMAVCVLGFLASAEELFIHLAAKEYKPQKKSILPFSHR